MLPNSTKLFQKAKKLIPGGVNSPVRSFKQVQSSPLFIKCGKGQYIFDVDDNCYIDYVGSWGPLILGHSHPAVISALAATMENGLSFGAPTELEIQLAELVQQFMPSIEQIRMVNSGTEATLSVLRLARGFTKRDKILKFEGCYHGHHDSLLIKGGSGLLTLGIPDSAGIPEDFTKHTLTAPFNDLAGVEKIMSRYGQEIAAVIVEPIAANNNLISPHAEFLPGLRALCDQTGALLIFDEVMTGFRVAAGGAQGYYNVTPDLTCLGKIIGGGLPVGAFGGKQEVMQCLAPVGPVYQAGTLSGNPMAMTAGLATLRQLQKPGIYEQLTKFSRELVNGLTNAAAASNLPFRAEFIGGLLGFEFLEDTEHKRFVQFFQAMLKEGIYFAPSAYEANFMSLAHTTEDVQKTVDIAERVMRTL